ncbi:MAG TPA: maleylpyruvate isomerase family mycothiol-dependent enzyme [Acidimicrobiia bacterium]|nr:maleylpyruvate isomerase family mycothiol-dependent enzyme [Acidimicrobiia bacterium]
MKPAPELSDSEVEALLGAYALDACEPEETAAIDAVLARRDDLAAEADLLARAAAWLGAAQALRAPERLRSATLTAAVLRRTAPVDPVVDLYLSEAEHFAAVLDSLPPGALREVTANGLTARDLVVHVAAQESLLAQLVGRPTVPSVVETDIDARTDAMLTEFEGRSIDDVVVAWRAAVEANRGWALEHRDETTLWRGIELSRHDAIVVRAFETWVHADDLRRVGNLATQAPEPRHLALMTDLAGRSLGLSLALVGRERRGRTARLVLTGDGGGNWLVAMGGGTSNRDNATVDVTVTADAVDWCRLVGDRLTPDEIVVDVHGDRALADDLLAAAPALASL